MQMCKEKYRFTGKSALLVALLAMPVIQAEAGIFDTLKKLVTSENTADETQPTTSLSENDVDLALKDALSVGIQTVVNQLGATDGFNLDPNIHISLPRNLDKARSTLGKMGMSSTFDELELSLNRAAEAAVPKTRELLLDAVQALTLEDVMTIYKGQDDAATQYFRNQMSEPLSDAMRPVVKESLDDVGAAQLYSQVADTYNDLPFVMPVDGDLTGFVLGAATDAIFHYLAREEAAIRKDPVKRTTELLKRAFGGTD